MSSIEAFRTVRLLAERLDPDHLVELCCLYQDPNVMATLSVDGKVLPELEVERRLCNDIDHWKRYGFGLWMFRDASSGQFVGRGGLRHTHIGDNDEVELAYTVLSPFWGRGLATEMAQASLNIAFEQLNLSNVVCFTLTSNRASQRVMDKVGLKYERNIIYVGLPHVLYRVNACEWKK